jgi:UDP-N-acetylmuramyl pentapeptide synthase
LARENPAPISVRRRFVSIAGSCGKTTTTKLIKCVLSSLGNCEACTNEPWRVHQRIRVREAVLSVAPSTKYYAYETASIGPGSISSQLDILRPHIGVVTTVGTDHLRIFRNIEAVAREKGDLAESLPPNGTAILNIDDPYVRAMATRTSARVVTYGQSCEADIRGEDVASAWPQGLTLRRYRQIARDALAVADRVVFVGPHSSHIQRLRQGDAFQTAYEASDFLSREPLPGELIYIKASRAADHLERIMLSQLDEVVCWRKRCRKVVNCPSCYRYRHPHIPAN